MGIVGGCAGSTMAPLHIDAGVIFMSISYSYAYTSSKVGLWLFFLRSP